jgi:hypothetical protein
VSSRPEKGVGLAACGNWRRLLPVTRGTTGPTSNPVRIQGPFGPSDRSGAMLPGVQERSSFPAHGNQVKAVFDLLSAEAQIVRPLAPPIIWSAFLRRTFSGGRGPWLTSMWRASPPNHSGVIPASQALATFTPNSRSILV